MASASPTQIDCIASFVEACGELEREPFFGKDEQLGTKGAVSSKVWFLGDRFHFRSALISFRRLWMRGEPSYWGKIAGLLTQPGVPPEVTAMAANEAAHIRASIGMTLYPTKMTAEHTVELWLNTVFAHGGIEGKNKRADFEAAVNAHGHAAFEFACRQAVRVTGTHLINLSRSAARPALEHYEVSAGIKPSFRIGAAFGTKLRERTSDGHLIIRRASSEFFQEETMADRFIRILGRSEHRDIKYVLDGLEANSADLLRIVLLRDSLAGVLDELEGAIRLASMEGDVTERAGMRSSSGIGSTRVNVYVNNVVETDSMGVPALDAAFKVFRDQVLREKSCSL